MLLPPSPSNYPFPLYRSGLAEKDLSWPHVDSLNPQNTALEAIFPVELKEVIPEKFALKGRRGAAPLPFKLLRPPL